MRILEQISQRVLKKSRAYYYPPQARAEGEGNDEFLSDKAFSEMLSAIDAFSEQFSRPPATDTAQESPPEKCA